MLILVHLHFILHCSCLNCVTHSKCYPRSFYWPQPLMNWVDLWPKVSSVPSVRTSPSSSCWSTPGLSHWSLNPEPDWRLYNRPSLRGALSPVWGKRAAGSARRRRSRPPGERPEVSAVWAPGSPAQASERLSPFRFHSETCSRRLVQRAKMEKSTKTNKQTNKTPTKKSTSWSSEATTALSRRQSPRGQSSPVNSLY